MSASEPSPPQKSDAAPAVSSPPSALKRADRGLGRLLFYAIWVVGLPAALALNSVWLLTPGPDSAPEGIRGFIGDQQIPSAIVFFTIFAMILWNFRHILPFGDSIGAASRRDVPRALRAQYEEAAALIEEARRVMKTNKRSIERDLPKEERAHLTTALEQLEIAMAADPFQPSAFEAALGNADAAVGDSLAPWRKGELREYGESIGIAVAVALLLRAFVVEAFKIPSGSMIPTLMVGDHIFVNKFAYGPLIPFTDTRLFANVPPARADVMVFKFPENKEQDFIKRTIALPGDTLEAIDGRPIINDWLVPQCYVGHYSYENRGAELYVEYLGNRSYVTLYDHKPTEQSCRTDDDCSVGLNCRQNVCGLLEGPFHVSQNEVWVMGDNRDNSHDSRRWRNRLGAGVPYENIKGRAMFVWMSFGAGNHIASERLFVNVMGEPKLSGAEAPLLSAKLKQCFDNPPKETTPPTAKTH